MKGGRKNLKRAIDEQSFSLEDGQTIMKVVSLRGSNLIEVIDGQNDKLLAFFPAKFQKSMWMKRGSFVVVDESGKEKAVESGSKVTCVVTRVLFFEQVRELQKSPKWPEVFKSTPLEEESDESNNQQHTSTKNEDDESDDSDDDDLPPLEANTNRIRPYGSDSDSEEEDL
ncbi:hypothetical protein ACFE04_005370 [Oxalis oulophora]